MRSNASHRVPVNAPAFTGTHCTCLWKDGQAELTLVPGYDLFAQMQSLIQLLSGPSLA